METRRNLVDTLAAAKLLETKYRDIADGNHNDVHPICFELDWLETKYRDIADGNQFG